MTSTARASNTLSSLPAAHSSSLAAGNASFNVPPYFRSVVSTKKQPEHLVKIVKAKMTAATKRGGKPSFTFTGQTYLKLTETTANVANVCEEIQKQWGSEYTMVSTDGLEIEDCSATQSESQYSFSHL